MLTATRALRVAAVLAAACVATTGTAVHAQQNYPAKPIRFIVPFAPGGGGDIIVRAVAQKLTQRLDVSVVVDNRTGAGGNVGTEIAAHALPDGYTLLMANVAPMAINVSVYKPLPYDPMRDFSPVTLMASFPNVLVVHPAAPAHSIAELIALARVKPGELTYASAGNGSTTHLAAEFFRAQAGLKLIHVPYKGGGPALTDLLAGQVTMYFGSMPASLPHIRAGRLRGLGVTSLQRSRAAPDIPTVADSGFPGFEAVTWIGAVAPAGTPRAIVGRLNQEIAAVVHEPDVAQRLEAQGAEPVSDTPEAFADYIRSEIRKWAGVVRDAGIATP